MRVTCVRDQSAPTPFSWAGPNPTAGLSPVNRLRWLEQVQDADLGGIVVAVAAALIRFHNSQTGLTCPSLESIVRVAGFCERSVRKAITALVEGGFLRVTRRQARSSHYGLALKPAPGAGQEPAEAAGDTPSWSADRQEAPALPAPGAAKQGKETSCAGRGITPGATDLEVERLARRIQQASATPWQLDNARRDVLDAVGRVGADLVRGLAERLAGQGLQAWEVRRELEGLAVARQRCEESAGTMAIARPLEPVAAYAVQTMEGLDASCRLRWHARARRAGAQAPMFELREWVPAIADEFLATEQPRVWARFQGEGNLNEDERFRVE
ncbi:hypothetical protein UAJ10_12615 [Nitrospirillum sp. BR 11164]|uniref:hypothetical protein n=1 Tax=Nitrospirillum sp. BR 11164 TaxID=3104324 RepID=UPI002AFDDCA0|nr:hypothetical protein [Nitrospirillum sp. BR 11164]MEA1649854.1 hypothetical protein [Nitrospirillum sp. BR 11164]